MFIVAELTLGWSPRGAPWSPGFAEGDQTQFGEAFVPSGRSYEKKKLQEGLEVI